jgi:MFS family permease
LSTSQPPVERRGGLANVVDIVIAPNAAFERLRQVPVWGWAFLVAALLGIAGSLLFAPALIHAAETTLPAKLAAMPQMAKLPPDQQQSAIALQLNISRTIFRFFGVFVIIQILLGGLVQAVAMLIANAAGRGNGSFQKFFALSVTVAVIGVGLAFFAEGLIVAVRGANSFDSQISVTGALPSFALIVPAAAGALLGFLTALNVFNLWATALLALGMQRIGRISAGAAWATSIILLLLSACLAAWGTANG